MTRELSSFPLSPNQLSTLKNAGFVHSGDVVELSPSQLSKGICVNVILFLFFIFTTSLFRRVTAHQLG